METVGVKVKTNGLKPPDAITAALAKFVQADHCQGYKPAVVHVPEAWPAFELPGLKIVPDRGVELGFIRVLSADEPEETEAPVAI